MSCQKVIDRIGNYEIIDLTEARAACNFEVPEAYAIKLETNLVRVVEGPYVREDAEKIILEHENNV